jgi:hypothetical protein
MPQYADTPFTRPTGADGTQPTDQGAEFTRPPKQYAAPRDAPIRESDTGAVTRQDRAISPVGKVVDAVVSYGFGRLGDSALDGIAAFWNTADDPLTMDHEARVLDEANRLLHRDVLGDPVRAITLEQIGPLSDLVGDVASEAWLPSDGAYVWIKRGVYVTGIVSGLAASQPFMAIASFKSLVFSEFKAAAVSAVTDAITEPLKRRAEESIDEPRRQLPDIVELTELARQFTQIQGPPVRLGVRQRQTLRYAEFQRIADSDVDPPPPLPQSLLSTRTTRRPAPS